MATTTNTTKNVTRSKARTAPEAHIDFLEMAPQVVKAGTKAKKTMPRITAKGVLEYASICHVMDTLEGFLEGPKMALRDQQIDYALLHGMAEQKTPDNPEAVEGAGVCKMILGQRKSTRALDDIQQAYLKQHGIETQTVKTWKLNPDPTVTTPEVLKALQTALNSVKGLPLNLFVSETKTIVTDNSLDQCFRQKSKDVAKECLKICGEFSLRPRVEGEPELQTIERVVKLLGASTTKGKK